MKTSHLLSAAAAIGLLVEAATLSSANATADSNSPPVVAVTAEDYAFRAPREIPSGWTTLALENTGNEHHFIFLSRLPDGISFDDYMVQLAQPFDDVWRSIDAGERTPDEGLQQILSLLPAWFGDVTQMGGTGLLAPGLSTRTTLYLPPGQYVMECYMKTEEGVIHAMDGMARPLTVTPVSNGAEPPSADLTVTLSDTGIDAPSRLASGPQTIAVQFLQQPEVGFGYDLHIARLDRDGDAAEIPAWMDWYNVRGLRTPAAANFFGGTHELPTGETAYVEVNLAPGNYAFVSETAPDRMFHNFVVSQ